MGGGVRNDSGERGGLVARPQKPKVNLNAWIGVRVLVGGPVPDRKTTIVKFDVTNLGERPVTVSLIGWRIGKGGNRRDCVIPLTIGPGDQVPKTLAYGESAQFIVLVKGSEHWIPGFADQFIDDLSERSIRTLRGQIHTSVGHAEIIVPEEGVLEELRRCRQPQ